MISIRTDNQQINFDNRSFVLNEKDLGYTQKPIRPTLTPYGREHLHHILRPLL